MIEIDVAALIDALRHVDLAVAAPLPAVEDAVADAQAAAAEGRCAGGQSGLEEAHRHHRLDRRARRIEAAQRLVASRPMVVLAPPLLFADADPSRRLEERRVGEKWVSTG